MISEKLQRTYRSTITVASDWIHGLGDLWSRRFSIARRSRGLLRGTRRLSCSAAHSNDIVCRADSPPRNFSYPSRPSHSRIFGTTNPSDFLPEQSCNSANLFCKGNVWQGRALPHTAFHAKGQPPADGTGSPPMLTPLIRVQ